MSISTGKGDKGQTSLWTGERVWKDSLRVEAYGTIDELNSHIGEARHFVKTEEVKTILLEIQNDLFKVAGQLASLDKIHVHPVSTEDVDRLTEYVHHYENILQLKGFVIPGNTVQSAKLDICRTVVRRAERKIITLSHQEKVFDEVLQYINRLSDCIYILARFEEFKENKIEYKKY